MIKYIIDKSGVVVIMHNPLLKAKEMLQQIMKETGLNAEDIRKILDDYLSDKLDKEN